MVFHIINERYGHPGPVEPSEASRLDPVSPSSRAGDKPPHTSARPAACAPLPSPEAPVEDTALSAAAAALLEEGGHPAVPLSSGGQTIISFLRGQTGAQMG